jgi:ABC-type glycerol-3-phosphate transport system substrate-binding protein
MSLRHYGSESDPKEMCMTAPSRREFLRGAGTLAGAAALAGPLSACAREETGVGGALPAGNQGTAPAEVPTEVTAKVSGELRILLWSHFVPSHDKWFDAFAAAWGQRVGVKVTVDHIDQAQIPTRLAAEVQAGQGHDLVQHIAPLAQFEPSVLDLKDLVAEASKRWGTQLDVCRQSSSNPNTGRYYAFAPGWSPDPGNYRRSLWDAVGLADGPSTWDDLLTGGTRIKSEKNVQLGLGLSQEVDSNMVARALLWSFGASEQDVEERVVLGGENAEAAVAFMSQLFRKTMTDEVFSWNAASNNQGLVAGKLSYIVNSISAWRTAQDSNPELAGDVRFVRPLRGPKAALAAPHVLYNWIVPSYAAGKGAAQEFLLHYTNNFASATYHSKLYDLCAWPSLTPDAGTWLGRDPFGGRPDDVLGVLGNAVEWTRNLGHPGPASPAVGEVMSTYVLPNMFARAARGEATPAEAVADAQAQIEPIFAKWRAQGLVGS